MPSSARTFLQGRARYLRAVLLFILASLSLYSAEPSLDYIFPVAWPRGTTNLITLGGKLDPWPVNVWTDCSALEVVTQTNTGKFSVQIAKEAPLGPHLLRVFNKDGASVPRLFLISEQMDTEEKEPNDSLKQAENIQRLPVMITGRLEKGGDVDSFAVHVMSDKWLIARVDAYSIGAPVDALLHLFNDKGLRVAFNHDSAKNIDPLLAYHVEKGGTYILQVAGFAHPPEANVKFAGTPGAIYRLSITDGPLAHHVYPTGVQRGRKAQLQLFGWNLEQAGITNADFDASNVAADSKKEWLSMAGIQGQFPVIISDVPEYVEAQPNDKTNQAQRVSLPCVVTGRIDPPGEEDRFVFTVKKGERFEFEVISGALDLGLDAVLKIENAAGKVLAEDDDGGGRPDAKLIWESPSDGSYYATVSDRFGNGGKDCVYRLAVVQPKPYFRPTSPENVIKLEPGKTNELKLTVTRFDGYTNQLRVKVDGLPPGVTLQAGEVPPQNGDVIVSFFAATNAPPTNQPLRILLQATNSAPHEVAALFDLRGKDPKFETILNETDQLWLTVLPKPEPSIKKEEKKH